jgi:hypothetical protein
MTTERSKPKPAGRHAAAPPVAATDSSADLEEKATAAGTTLGTKAKRDAAD